MHRCIAVLADDGEGVEADGDVVAAGDGANHREEESLGGAGGNHRDEESIGGAGGLISHGVGDGVTQFLGGCEGGDNVAESESEDEAVVDCVRPLCDLRMWQRSADELTKRRGRGSWRPSGRWRSAARSF